jgi:lipopolysaccharide assembly protein A
MEKGKLEPRLSTWWRGVGGEDGRGSFPAAGFALKREPEMRYLLWIFKIALFVLVLSFAVKNTDTVTVRYYLDGEWQTPLIFVLLVSFCAGIGVGIIAGLSRMFRQRREIAALKRELRQHGRKSTGDAERTAELIQG